MPIIPLATLVAPGAVRYTWTGDAPFDVWVRGERLAYQVASTEFLVEFSGEAAEPWIEVRDANDSGPALSELVGPKLRMQWRGQVDAAFYQVQRKDGSEWVVKGLLAESQRGYYWHKTLAEADGALAEWRVQAEDARGYLSDVENFTQRVVCNPATPAVALTYDEGTGDLTVAEV